MRNFWRSLKYFVALCVLCIAVIGLMFVTGTSVMSFHDTLSVMFLSERSVMLLIAIVILSIFYPRFGFVQRKMEGDITQDRELILKAFTLAGYALREERDGAIYFRAENLFSRLMMLGEDEIKVSQNGTAIELDGIRRGVAKTEYRLRSYLESKKNE